jgi:hypothetical protein
MSDDKPPVPMIYGVRGEEFQLEPDPPRRLFRVWLVAGAIILAAVVGMWAL